MDVFMYGECLVRVIVVLKGLILMDSIVKWANCTRWLPHGGWSGDFWML